MDEKELQETIESFLGDPFWSGYYDAAPSGAKEIIALEFYMSSSERAHNDPEAWSVLEECRAALETEDIDYLAENSPNPYERAFYRKMLQCGGAGKDGRLKKLRSICYSTPR